MSHETSPPVPAVNAPSEPLLTAGTIITVFSAVLAAIVSFGLNISDDQQAKLLGVILVVAPLIVAVVGRIKAWSPASVRKLVHEERAKAAAEARPDPGTRGWPA
jgi:hypothetical protein